MLLETKAEVKRNVEERKIPFCIACKKRDPWGRREETVLMCSEMPRESVMTDEIAFRHSKGRMEKTSSEESDFKVHEVVVVSNTIKQCASPNFFSFFRWVYFAFF